jgi:hypothetical protein
MNKNCHSFAKAYDGQRPLSPALMMIRQSPEYANATSQNAFGRNDQKQFPIVCGHAKTR